MTGPDSGRERRPTRPGRAAVLVVGAVLAVLLAGAAAVTAAASPGAAVLDGTSVDGRDVGGLSRAELASAVDDLADRRLAEPVEVDGDRDRVEATRADAGVTVDREQVVERAWQRGRDLPGGWLERLRARLGATLQVPLVERVDQPARRAFAAAAAERLSEPPRDAGLRLVADEPPRVEASGGRPGEVVDAEALDDRLAEALSSPGPVELEAPGSPGSRRSATTTWTRSSTTPAWWCPPRSSSSTRRRVLTCGWSRPSSRASSRSAGRRTLRRAGG